MSDLTSRGDVDGEYVMRLCNTILLIMFLSACGGGGGGGSKPAPPQPSISISGAETRYWQDDELRITFTARNMDTSTVVFSIDNLEQELADEYFYFDSNAGVLTDDPDYHMEAKTYSLVVKATDAAGTTASTTLSFNVDLVPTTMRAGTSWVTDIDGNEKFGDVVLTIARSGDLSIDFFDLEESLNFVCFGTMETSADDVSAAGECDGYLFDASTEVSRFEGDSYNLELFDTAGLALGTVSSAPALYLEALRSDNAVIPGVYWFVSQFSPPFRPADVSPSGYYSSEVPGGVSLMRVTDNFNIESLPSIDVFIGNAPTTAIDCQYAGRIDEASINEGTITSRSNNLLYGQNRTLSGDLSLSECELVLDNPVSQTDGRFTAFTILTYEGDHNLYITGSGNTAQDAPIWTGRFLKVCNNDGTPVEPAAGIQTWETVCEGSVSQ